MCGGGAREESAVVVVEQRAPGHRVRRRTSRCRHPRCDCWWKWMAWGGLCAACSRDGVGVEYRIGDNSSMPNDSHGRLATMDGGGGGHGPSPCSGHRGQARAGNAWTGALRGGAAGRAAYGAAVGATNDITECRDGGATLARRRPPKRHPTGERPWFLSRSRRSPRRR
jgi:hypothetical protein